MFLLLLFLERLEGDIQGLWLVEGNWPMSYATCNFGDLKWHLSMYKISPTVRSLICKYGYFKSKSSVSLQQWRIGTPYIPPSETVLCPKMIWMWSTWPIQWYWFLLMGVFGLAWQHPDKWKWSCHKLDWQCCRFSEQGVPLESWDFLCTGTCTCTWFVFISGLPHLPTGGSQNYLDDTLQRTLELNSSHFFCCQFLGL